MTAPGDEGTGYLSVGAVSPWSDHAPRTSYRRTKTVLLSAARWL